jgi:segregation and condensation protein B
MSRKPSKKSESSPSSDSSEPGDHDSTAEDQNSEVSDNDPVESKTVDEDEGFDDEEFSLDQLSQAYAEVLKSRPGVELKKTETDSEDDDESDQSLAQNNACGEAAKVDDNQGCPISPESIIESILFVGAPKDVKLNSRKIAAVLRDVSPKEVTKTVRELNKKYEQENAAYRIESDGGVFKMVLDPKLVDFQQEFFGRNRQVRLSQAAIDVMAIVAYNQPVTREQVEKIRGRPSGSVLSQLVRRELLFVEPGKENPKIRYYTTSDRFLDLFQLEELADLPQSHEVSDIEELAD